MSETKFTPGPWWQRSPHHRIIDSDSGPVCRVYVEGEQATLDLIAAAPDLYAALAEMCRMFTHGNPDQRAAISAGLAALDKARGEEP